MPSKTEVLSGLSWNIWNILECSWMSCGTLPGMENSSPQITIFEVLKVQIGFPDGSKIDPGASWRALGAVLAAWRPLGGHLEDSRRRPGPKEGADERLLSAPRRISRQFSTILGPKRLPKRSLKGSQIGFRRRLELKKATSQNSDDVSQNSLIFQVPGLPVASKTGSETGSKTRSRR